MRYISHRGNLNGAQPERENSPSYIMEALRAGWEVEVDIRYIDGKWWLGHDEPQYSLDDLYEEFDFYIQRIWFHAKNIEAFYQLMEYPTTLKTFMHDRDDAALISTGNGNYWFWNYPGKPLTPRSIAVMPEWVDGWDITGAAGICSDYIARYRDGVI